MKGVSFLTDETHNKRYVQLDLDEVAAIGPDGLGHLLDTILAENRRNEEQGWEDISRLIQEEGF